MQAWVKLMVSPEMAALVVRVKVFSQVIFIGPVLFKIK
jgi:hypothetical protein